MFTSTLQVAHHNMLVSCLVFGSSTSLLFWSQSLRCRLYAINDICPDPDPAWSHKVFVKECTYAYFNFAGGTSQCASVLLCGSSRGLPFGSRSLRKMPFVAWMMILPEVIKFLLRSVPKPTSTLQDAHHNVLVSCCVGQVQVFPLDPGLSGRCRLWLGWWSCLRP